jgi:hypothetical protein
MMTKLAESIHEQHPEGICALAGLLASAEKKALISRFELSFINLACVLAVLSMALGQAMHAQTFTVLHTFRGSPDGANPADGVVIDRAGNLYGVTLTGGMNGNGCTSLGTGCGTVFKLTKRSSGWIYSTLYKFQGPPDGNYPAGVVVGPDGTLYGATTGGGIVNNIACPQYDNGCGTVFRLRPPATFCATPLCPWNESVLYTFTGNADGGNPHNGDLVFDGARDIYGTTLNGGAYAWGAAYELAPSQGGYSESVIYNFNSVPDGLASPYSGFIMDQSGNLYGTTAFSNDNLAGTIYQLTPSQSGWTANILQSFQCRRGFDPGCFPQALIFDSAGNLLGGTANGSLNDRGAVIKLLASDDWSLDVLYTFGLEQGLIQDHLTMDAAGNIYGTGFACSNLYGCVYKLTPSSHGYIYTELHDFTDGADGAHPYGPVAIDADGNIYGTAENGGDLNTCRGQGDDGCGVVWEITP